MDLGKPSPVLGLATAFHFFRSESGDRQTDNSDSDSVTRVRNGYGYERAYFTYKDLCPNQ
jgi:hypothetical protein